MEGAISDSVSQLIEYRKQSVSRSAFRRRAWLIFAALVTSIVVGFFIGGQEQDNGEVPSAGFVAAIAGALLASIFTMILALLRMKRLREIQNRQEFDLDRVVHAARTAALNRIEANAERIYEDDSLSPRERRKRLAEVSQELDSLNELI